MLEFSVDELDAAANGKHGTCLGNVSVDFRADCVDSSSPNYDCEVLYAWIPGSRHSGKADSNTRNKKQQ